MDTPDITKAEGAQETTQETPVTVPETPTIESLQSRIAEKDKLISDLQSQVKGRSKENAKLQQAVNDRATLRQELRDEVAQVVREQISALGDVLFADEEPDSQQQPTKKQLLQQRLKAPEKKPVPQITQEQYDEAIEYRGRIKGLWEETGVKLEDLPEELTEEAEAKYRRGEARAAFQDLQKGVKDYLKKKDQEAQARETEQRKEKEKKASLVTIDRVTGSGAPASGSIEVLRAKLRTNQYLTPEEYRRLDEYNTQRLKDLTKGAL